MKALTITSVSLLLGALSGCSSDTPSDVYQEMSFELCNTNIKVYSISDDGRVRVICEDGSKFAMKNEKTLYTMKDINIEYCDGGGLGKFNESKKYYSFKCKSGALLSIPK
ncbi:hypothetical protein N9R79_01870 [Vibrio sp.]|nr:hypothetical protein [Vibrio sp.]